ncbi:hypothetical protein D051_0756 [Vibrio parahaemolyticus VPCR-2010]|nr:hypothetical protein D051_0756 [Vibrio parahaemolyticus VPCR-2010]
MIYQLVCWVNVLPNDVCDRSKRVFHGCVGERVEFFALYRIF